MRIRHFFHYSFSAFLISSLIVGPLFVLTTFSHPDDESGVGGEPVTVDNPVINDLNQKIQDKKGELEQIQARQEEYKRLIQQKQQEQVSLKNQIQILNASIAQAELDIQSTQIGIDTTTLEIKKVGAEIAQLEKDIADKKEYLTTLVRRIAEYDNITTLEVLIVNKSLSEFLDQIQYIQTVNSNLKDVVDEVKSQKTAMEEQQKQLEKKHKELEQLKKDLEERQAQVEDQKDGKQYILDKTRQSEQQYQQLLKQAKSEQDAANAEIVRYEREIRKKLAERQTKDGVQLSDKGFIWPVPKNVITAYFHDPDYPFRNVFEHPAIDIRAGQGTPIRAVASGYVAKAKDNGYGYSYIMIVHADGLSTVYGHVSRIDVKPDQFVSQGDIIGASGGMPGTRGAGYLTTGPHLHLEYRLNGIPVNPLNYLP